LSNELFSLEVTFYVSTSKLHTAAILYAFVTLTTPTHYKLSVE